MSSSASYLLLGPETGEKERFVAQLRAEKEKAAGEPPEVSSFYAFEIGPAEVVSLLRNGSLFSTHRVVLYKGVDSLTRKDELEPLLAYLGSPNPEVTLILTAETTSVDRRLEQAHTGEQKKIFWELFENQKRGWIAQYFRQAGLRVEPEATLLLLELVGNTTDDLGRECGKLVQYLGKGATVDEQAVETYIFHSKEENVFTLFDRIASGDLPSSIETLQSILLSGDSNPIALLAGLLWQFRRLHQIEMLLHENYELQEACVKVGVRSKRSQKSYAEAVRHYALADAEAIISLLARFDGEVRAIRSDLQPLLLEIFVYCSVARKGKALEPYRT